MGGGGLVGGYCDCCCGRGGTTGLSEGVGGTFGRPILFGTATYQELLLGEAGVRDALEGGEVPPLPGGAQPMPSHCLPDGKWQPQWHLQPTVTAPNRFGNLLQPHV